MPEIRAAIIDDEKNNVENLTLLLQKYCPEINIIASADNALSGIDMLKTHAPELLFLDIEMPFGNGFKILEALAPVNFEVIFTTAYDQYAIKAIKFCALDYLLKPIDVFELKTAVEKAKQKITNKENNERLSQLVDNMKTDAIHKKLALPGNERTEFIGISNIIRCKGENNYTSFVIKDHKEILVSKTLKEYEEILSDAGFLRVHQSHLVNMNHVKAFDKTDGGYLITSDNFKVPVSRNKKEWVLQKLNDTILNKGK